MTPCLRSQWDLRPLSVRRVPYARMRRALPGIAPLYARRALPQQNRKRGAPCAQAHPRTGGTPLEGRHSGAMKHYCFPQPPSGGSAPALPCTSPSVKRPRDEADIGDAPAARLYSLKRRPTHRESAPGQYLEEVQHPQSPAIEARARCKAHPRQPGCARHCKPSAAFCTARLNAPAARRALPQQRRQLRRHRSPWHIPRRTT